MLVLTRKNDQSIMIGAPASAEKAIEITVVEIRDGQVRLGITAPKSITVHRKEVYEEIQQQNEAASRTPVNVPGSTVGLTLDEIRRRGKAPYSPH